MRYYTCCHGILDRQLLPQYVSSTYNAGNCNVLALVRSHLPRMMGLVRPLAIHANVLRK